MPSVTLGKVGRGAAAASAACLVWLCLSASPALAGDDGAAPLWVGLGSMFGFGGAEDQPDIDYRDRPKLVVPPKMDLPPPAAAPWAERDRLAARPRRRALEEGAGRKEEVPPAD